MGGVDLELVPDLVERDSGGGLFPFGLRQFQELVQYKAGGFLAVPAVGG